MSWRRHQPDTKFHTGTERGGSFATPCRGRWSLTDETEGLVEHQPSPPHEDRCEVCQRHDIETRRIELGLRELAAEAPAMHVITWPFDLSDVVGGEA